MKGSLLAGAMALGMAVSASAAGAAVIDLGALPGGAAANPLVETGATFTTLGGGFNVIVPGQGLCDATVAGDSAVCTDTLQVDFTTASAPISFVFFDNNDQGVGDNIGSVSLFAGATHLGDVAVLVADSSPFTADTVSLTGFTGVTRMLITSTDPGGVVYGLFAFTPGGVGSGAPEPATWALAIAGFGLAGAALRRRRALLA